MAEYEQVTYNSPDGAKIGDSATEKIGFWGSTPVVRATATALTAIATTVFSEAKTGIWGFGSSTAAKLYRTRINQIIVDIAALKTAGMFS